jgi:hypothetical protein
MGLKNWKSVTMRATETGAAKGWKSDETGMQANLQSERVDGFQGEEWGSSTPIWMCLVEKVLDEVIGNS